MADKFFEGFLGQAADRVRQWFRSDKSQAGLGIAKGATTSALPMSGQDMTQAYGYDSLSDYLRLEHDLLSRFIDYEEMDDYDLIANAIDIFADDATQLDIDRKRAVWVSSPDKTIAEMGEDLFHRRLRIDEEIWEIARTVVKYGNDYEELLLTDNGVVGLNYLAPATVRRIEGQRGELYGFIQNFNGKFGFSPSEFQQVMQQRNAAMQGLSIPGRASGLERVTAFEDWEVVHFRIRGKHRRSAYGSSVLEPARWISKRLTLLEDSAMIYRLQRAAERYAFYVDIGNLPPQEALAHLNRIRQQHRKQKFINPATGKLDLKPEFLNQNDDFFVPVSNGSEGTRIEVLGSPNWQCLTGDTKIPLLDGSSPTIAELSTRGGDFWVYSIDSAGRVVPGKGHSARVTHESAEIWEVTLDNGEVIRCTGNHPFMTREGKWCLAENLREDDSLMPLYRKVSAKKNADYLDGYEQVYDPAKDKYVYTHHRVFETCHGSCEKTWQSGQIIHHENHQKLDNRPENLNALSRKEHALEHAEYVKFMHTPEARAKLKATQASSEYRQRLKDSFTEERRAVLSAHMRKRMQNPEERAEKAKILADWNRSEDHRQRVSGKNSPRWRDVSLLDLEQVVLTSGARNMKELFARTDWNQYTVEKVLKAEGMTWRQFAEKNIPGWVAKGRAKAVTNHKVVSVRKTSEKAVVYDLTVDEHHNFAVAQGVFVHNSVDDLMYFKDKLLASLKIPKTYLAQADGGNRGTLSSEDVRFARTVLRIQNELRNGLSKVFRIHLTALGIDPHMVQYGLHMTVPSAIFELAQLEVKNARADFAARMQAFVSYHWILSKVFGMSDDEIQVVMEQRSEDAEREGNIQATSQSIIQRNVAQAGIQGQTAGQIDANHMMQQAGMAQPQDAGPAQSPLAAGMQPMPGANGMTPPQPMPQESRIGGPLIKIAGPRKTEYYGLEKKLFEGAHRKTEQRMEEQLEGLLKNDRRFTGQLIELRSMLHELNAAVSGRRR